uniref:Uncharacterized protein n=1 Tax=Marmota marmota marmota TaxID=9994 RepID=A0A8C5YR04_MARMA
METLALKPEETALSTQDPALSPKENPEDKSDWSLLAARSEVSSVFSFLYMKRVGTLFFFPCIFSQPWTSPTPHKGPTVQSSGSSR